MELKIDHLGLINEAILKFGDISIILGPPNTGKSYTLRALYHSLIIFDKDIVKQAMYDLIIDEFNDFVKKLDIKISETFTTLFKLLSKHLVTKHSRRHIIDLNEIESLEKNILENIEKDIKLLNKENNTSLFILERPQKEENAYNTNFDIQVNINEQKEIDVNNLIIRFKEHLENSKYEFLPINDEKTKIRLNKYELPDFKILIMDLLNQFVNEKLYFETRSSRFISSKFVSRRIKEIKQGKIEICSSITDNKLTITGSAKYLVNIPLFLTRTTVYKDDPYFYESYFDLSRTIRRYVRKIIYEHFSESFELYISESPIKEVIFIPFGRTPLIYLLEYDFLAEIMDNLILNSYLIKLKKGIQLLSKKDRPEDIIKLFASVIQGDIKYDKLTKKLRYQKYNSPDLPIEFSSALASEIAGILLPVLTLPPNSFIIIEEPEAQLHYSAQILMALVLVALSKKYGHKIIFSTHSDIFTITFAYLEKLNYNKNDIIKLIKDLLSVQGITVNSEQVDIVANFLSSEKEEISVKYYYYEPSLEEGVRIMQKSSEMIMEEVPGITNVTEILASWALNVIDNH